MKLWKHRPSVSLPLFSLSGAYRCSHVLLCFYHHPPTAQILKVAFALGGGRGRLLHERRGQHVSDVSACRTLRIKYLSSSEKHLFDLAKLRATDVLHL